MTGRCVCWFTATQVSLKGLEYRPCSAHTHTHTDWTIMPSLTLDDSEEMNDHKARRDECLCALLTSHNSQLCAFLLFTCLLLHIENCIVLIHRNLSCSTCLYLQFSSVWAAHTEMIRRLVQKLVRVQVFSRQRRKQEARSFLFVQYVVGSLGHKV